MSQLDSIDIPLARQKEIEDSITGAMADTEDNFFDTFANFMGELGEGTMEAGKTALMTAPEALFSWVPNGATNAANYVNTASVMMSGDKARMENLQKRWAAQETLRDEAALKKMAPEQIQQLIADSQLETTEAEEFFTDTTGKLSVYSLLPKDTQLAVRAQQALNPVATAATEVAGQIVQYAPTPWGGAVGAVTKTASVPGLLTRTVENLLKAGVQKAVVKPFSASKFGAGLNRMMASEAFRPLRAAKASPMGKFLSKVADLNMTDLATSGLSSALVDSLFGDAKATAQERVWNGMVMGMVGYTGYKVAANVSKLYSNKFIFDKLPEDARRQIANGDDLMRVAVKNGVGRLHPVVAKTLSVGLESFGNAWVDTHELMKSMSVLYNSDEHTDKEIEEAKSRLVGIVGGSFLGTLWGRVGNRPVWADYVQKNPELADNKLYMQEVEARYAKRMQGYQENIARTTEEIAALRRNIGLGAKPGEINIEYTRSLVGDIERAIGVNEWMESQGAGKVGVARLVNSAQQAADRYMDLAFSRAVQGGPTGETLAAAREQGIKDIDNTFTELYREMDAELGEKVSKGMSAGEEAKLREQGVAALTLARDKSKALLDANIDRGIMELFNKHQQAQMQLAESQRVIDASTQVARENILGTALSGMTPEQRSRLGSEALVGHQTTIFGAGAKMVDRLFSTQWRNQFQVEGVDRPWSAKKFSNEAESNIDAAAASATEEVNSRYDRMEKESGENFQPQREAELRAVQESASAAKEFFNQSLRDQQSDMRSRWDHARAQIAIAQGVNVDQLGNAGTINTKLEELRALRAAETDPAKRRQIDEEINKQKDALRGAEQALKRFVDSEDMIRSTSMDALKQMHDEANERQKASHQQWQADQQARLERAEQIKLSNEKAYERAKMAMTQGLPRGEDETKAFTALTKHGGWFATLRHPQTGFIQYYPNGGDQRLFVRGSGDNFEVMINRDVLDLFPDDIPEYLSQANDELSSVANKLDTQATFSLTGDAAHKLISDINYLMMANQMRGHATFTRNGIKPLPPYGGGVYVLDGKSYIRGADGKYRSKWAAAGNAREEKMFDSTVVAESMVRRIDQLQQTLASEQDPKVREKLTADITAMNEALAKERAEIAKRLSEPDNIFVSHDPGKYELLDRQLKDPTTWNRHSEANPIVKLWINFVTRDLRNVAMSDESLLSPYMAIEAAMDMAARGQEDDPFVLEMVKFLESIPEPADALRESGMDASEIMHRLAMEMGAIGMGRGNAESSIAKMTKAVQENQAKMEQEGLIRRAAEEGKQPPPEEPPADEGGEPVEPTPKPTEGPVAAEERPPVEAEPEPAPRPAEAKPTKKRTRKVKTQQGQELPFTSMTDLVDAKPMESSMEDRPAWEMDINEFMQQNLKGEVDPEAEQEMTKFYYQRVLAAAAEGKPVNPEYVRDAEAMVESGDIEAPAGYKAAKKKTVVGLEAEQGPELTPEERKRRASYPIAQHNVTSMLVRQFKDKGLYTGDLKGGDINLTHKGRDLHDVLYDMQIDAEDPNNQDTGKDISMRVEVEVEAGDNRFKEEDIFIERINGQWSMRFASDAKGKERGIFGTQRPVDDLTADNIAHKVIQPAVEKILGIKDNARLARRPLTQMVVVPEGGNINQMLKILKDEGHPIREVAKDNKDQKVVSLVDVVQEIGTANDDGSDVSFEIVNTNSNEWSGGKVKTHIFPRVFLERKNGQWSVRNLQGKVIPVAIGGEAPAKAPAAKPGKKGRVIKGSPGDPELGGTIIFDPVEWNRAVRRTAAKAKESISYASNRLVQFFGSDAEFIKNIDADTGQRMEQLHDDDRRVRGELHYQAVKIIRDLDALPNRAEVRDFAQERVLDPNSNSFTTRLQMAVEGIPFPDGATPPKGFQIMVDGYRKMFYESGRFLQEAGLVTKFADGRLDRFTADPNRHRFIRMMTPEFYDIIRGSENDPRFTALVDALANGNARTPEQTRERLRSKLGREPTDAEVTEARDKQIAGLKQSIVDAFKPELKQSTDEAMRSGRVEYKPVERTIAADFARTLRFFPTTIRIPDKFGGPDSNVNILADDFDSIISRMADETGLRYAVVNNFGNDISIDQARQISERDPSLREVLSSSTVLSKFDQAIKRQGLTRYSKQNLENVLRRVQDISAASFVDARGKVSRFLMAAEGERRMAELTISSVANLVEPLGSLPGFVGSKRTMEALKRTLTSLGQYAADSALDAKNGTRTALFEVRDAAIRNGAVMTGISTRLFDTNRFSGKTMEVLRAIVSGGFEYTQQFAEIWAAETGRVTVDSWKQGKFLNIDKFMLRNLGFNDAQINAFKTGNFSPDLEKAFIGRLSGAATATQTTTRRSYVMGNKWINLALPFNRYYLGRMKFVARMMIEVAKSKNQEDALGATHAVASHYFGTAVTGALAVFLMQSLYTLSPKEVALKMAREAVGNPSDDLVTRINNLVGYSAKMYVSQTFAGPGIGAVGSLFDPSQPVQSGARAVLPFDYWNSIKDALNSSGPYRGMNFWEKLSVSMERATPAAKMVNRLVSSFTVDELANDVARIVNDVNELERENRETYLITGAIPEKKVEFHRAVRDLMKEFRRGMKPDSPEVMEKIDEALKVGVGEDLRAAIRSMKNLEGQDIPVDLRKKVVDRIGVENFQKLQAYDDAIDDLADSVPRYKGKLPDERADFKNRLDEAAVLWELKDFTSVDDIKKDAQFLAVRDLVRVKDPNGRISADAQDALRRLSRKLAAFPDALPAAIGEQEAKKMVRQGLRIHLIYNALRKDASDAAEVELDRQDASKK